MDEESPEPNETIASEVGAVVEQEGASESVITKPTSLPQESANQMESTSPHQQDPLPPQPDTVVPSISKAIPEMTSSWSEPSHPNFTGPNIPSQDFLYDQIVGSFHSYIVCYGTISIVKRKSKDHSQRLKCVIGMRTDPYLIRCIFHVNRMNGEC